MRSLSLLLMIVCCGFTACKKASVSTGLAGKWEIRRMYGGFAGFDSLYNPGNGTIYQFYRDSTYKHFTKGKLDAQGKFHIKKMPDAVTQLVIYFGDEDYAEPLSINGLKMTIGTTVTDGLASDYQKISN